MCAIVHGCGETSDAAVCGKGGQQVTSGVREAVGGSVDNVKRSGWALSEEGRRERCERMEDALRARIVLEYSMV